MLKKIKELLYTILSFIVAIPSKAVKAVNWDEVEISNIQSVYGVSPGLTPEEKMRLTYRISVVLVFAIGCAALFNKYVLANKKLSKKKKYVFSFILFFITAIIIVTQYITYSYMFFLLLLSIGVMYFVLFWIILFSKNLTKKEKIIQLILSVIMMLVIPFTL